jgi:hypothetical protein
MITKAKTTLSEVANAGLKELNNCTQDNKNVVAMQAPRVLDIIGIANGGWLEPLPLIRTDDGDERFPLEALYPHLNNVTELLADSIKVPCALAAQSILAAATLAAQKHANVRIFSEARPISSNFLTVAKSGDRKSVVDRAALRAHRQYEKKLKVDYKAKNLDKVGTKFFKEPMLMATAPTVQGVATQLAGQSVVGIYAGEGGRFLGSYALKPENLLHTITTLSGLWDDGETDSLTAGEGGSRLYGRRFSSHLMIQPGLVPKLYNEEIEEHGFLGRILPIKPKSLAGEVDDHGILRRQYDGEPDEDIFQTIAYQAYFCRMTRLLEKSPQVSSDDPLELNPKLLVLDPEAAQEFQTYVNDVERRITSELSVIESLALKAPEHAARLAAVLALTGDEEADSIDVMALRSGIALMEYYLRQAANVKGTSLGNKPELISADKLRLWMRKHKKKEVVLVEIYQSGPSNIRTAAKARLNMQILEEHHWVRRAGIDRWEVHPSVSKF